MKKQIFNILILLLFTIYVPGQTFELIKDSSRQFTHIKFIDTVNHKNSKIINLHDLNPFSKEFADYKDSIQATSTRYYINGDLTLNDIIPFEERALFDPKIQAYNEPVEFVICRKPIVKYSENRKYLAVINIVLPYSKYDIIGAKGIVKIYSDYGKELSSIDFYPAPAYLEISDNGRYLTYTYELSGPDATIVKPGMSIFDINNKVEIYQESFKNWSHCPTVISRNGLQIVGKHSFPILSYLIFNPSNKTLYRKDITRPSRTTDIDITRNGIFMYDNSKEIDTVQFKFDVDFDIIKID